MGGRPTSETWGNLGTDGAFPHSEGGWPRSRCPFQIAMRLLPVPRTWGPGRMRTSIGRKKHAAANSSAKNADVVWSNSRFSPHRRCSSSHRAHCLRCRSFSPIGAQ